MPLKLAVETRGDRDAPGQRTLVRLGFGKAHAIGADPRDVTLGQPAFLTPSPVEHWQSDRPVETGRHGEIAFASDGRLLFGHLLLDETEGGTLETPAYHAYTAILAFLEAFGGQHLLRVWHILDAINRDHAGLERYRAFCIGRSRALNDAGFADQALPAASGVGANAPGLMISFIAASEPGMQIENPRQVSAFRYPERYGPKSPSFSRALTFPLTPNSTLLFISGTASIRGHETMHPGALDKQFDETCRNLDAVMNAAGQPCRLEALRVYIRHDEDAPDVIAMTRRHFGDDLGIIPLKSAICRSDLLLEIEGVAMACSAA
jgi:chorismate lyase / 3-hydroxybenzoate synthase